MDSPNTQQGLLPSKKGVKDSLYTELWRACAGSFVYVPREEETVLYFPQGHLEQVQSSFSFT
ncbi:Auxin response factor 18 [Glycine soja]|nr:Auxin response factor 18 [Glycine soja]